MADDAVNPARFDQYRHRQVNFLDLYITIVYSDGPADFAFKVYRKSGTAYAYMPYRSHLPYGSQARLSGLAQCRDAQAADVLQQL